MAGEWLKNLLTPNHDDAYTRSLKPEVQGFSETPEDLRRHETTEKKPDNSWYFVDTLNIAPDQTKKTQADAKKVSLYYRDTMGPAVSNPALMSNSDKIESSKSEEKSGSKHTSPYYQDSISASTTTENIISAEQIEKTNESEEDVQDIKKFTHLMNKFVEEAQEAEKAGEFDFAQLMAEVFKIQIQAQEDNSILTREEILKTRSDRKAVNTERMQKMEEVLKSAQETKVWSRFQAAATTLQFTAAAVGAGLSGTWAVAAVIFLLGLDQVFDDPAKKGVANYISGGNKESAAWWTTAFQYGALAVTLVGSLAAMGSKAAAQATPALTNFIQGIPLAANRWINGTLSGMNAATTGMKGWTTYKHDGVKGELYRLTDKITQKDDKIKSALNTLKTLVNEQYSLMRTWSQIKKSEGEVISSIFRNY